MKKKPEMYKKICVIVNLLVLSSFLGCKPKSSESNVKNEAIESGLAVGYMTVKPISCGNAKYGGELEIRRSQNTSGEVLRKHIVCFAQNAIEKVVHGEKFDSIDIEVPTGTSKIEYYCKNNLTAETMKDIRVRYSKNTKENQLHGTALCSLKQDDYDKIEKLNYPSDLENYYESKPHQLMPLDWLSEVSKIETLHLQRVVVSDAQLKNLKVLAGLKELTILGKLVKEEYISQANFEGLDALKIFETNLPLENYQAFENLDLVLQRNFFTKSIVGIGFYERGSPNTMFFFRKNIGFRNRLETFYIGPGKQ